MTRMALKVKVNYLNFQHQPRVSQDAYLGLISWFQLKSVTSYLVDKLKFTDGRTGGRTDAGDDNTLSARKRRGKNAFHNVMCDIIVWFFIIVLYVYNFSMLKAKWDRQIKVYNYFTKHIVRDNIHKTVLKEKYVKNTKLVIYCLFLK